MHGIGSYQPNLMYQDGVYEGLMVAINGSTNVVRVGTGLAIVGKTAVEQTPTGATTDITVFTNATNYIYVNHPDALDSTGAATATFDKVKEGDSTRTALNGSTSVARGRSLVLAKVTVPASTGTVTMTGTFADTETVTVTIGGTAVVTTLTAITAASVTTVAAAVAAAWNANATAFAKASAASVAGVVTFTSKQSVLTTDYTLTASDTAASGTATASGANLAIQTAVIDNTERLKLMNIPPAMWANSAVNL